MAHRYSDFVQQHPKLSAGVSVLGVATMILGASGTPSDIENWGKVFAAIGSDRARWVLVALGLALLVAAAIPWLSRKSASAQAATPELPTGPLIHSPEQAPRSTAERHPPPTFIAVEAEIALAHEEVIEMTKILRAEWPHITPDGAVVQVALPDWRAKTTEFMGTVLGAAQRAAFRGAAIGGDELERLEAEARFLSHLALNLSPGAIRLDEDEFLSARTQRRDHEAASFLQYDHSRAPGAPPELDREFGRRDDSGELAQRCHMLAASIERWAKSYESEQAESVEKMVKEWLATDPTVDPAEARRKAHDRYEKNWELEYSLKYRTEAKELFDQAYEMHEIAREHEQLAVRPLANEFARVPRLFNELAESLYANTA
jgi:hypothetical protein